MTTNVLRITEIDFDTILGNLRTWFQSQDQFKDYDFEGSGLSILLKNLAYNTHYNAFYLNMAVNEAFIGGAIVARNVYSHAKTLNYLPGSRIAAKATVDVTITPPPNYSSSAFTIPKYQQFVSSAIDGVSYSFVTTESLFGSRVTSFGQEPFLFSGVILSQGEPITITYTVDQTTNPKLRFEIPSANVDINTLSVQTQESASNTLITTWSVSSDITAIDSSTNAFFLERGSNGNYTLYFGDGIVGKKPNTGNLLLVSYLVTNGLEANKAQFFTMLPLDNVASVSVSTVAAAAGGDDEESIDSIKASAPIFYSTQGRAVTKGDFEVTIKKDFPAVGSVSVWGGEENNPPIYGKVFVALAPKEGFLISQAQKDSIVKKLVEERVTVSINPEIKDPDYTYVRLKSTVQYDKQKTNLTKGVLTDAIRNAIIDYNETNLRTFDSNFITSKLATAIDDSNPAILGNDTRVFLEKRFLPVIGRSGTYTLNFNTELKRGTVIDKLGSTVFQMLDPNGIEQSVYFEEKPLSFTGIDDIVVTNPGSQYLSPPDVVITGDGQGATASASIVNGMVKSIKVTNKGDSYTTALVTLNSDTGLGATAKPVIAARYGQLRIFYYNDLQQKVILVENAGTIDYLLGQIVITSFNPSNFSRYIALWLQTEEPIIQSVRGSILIIDTSDISSININLQESSASS